MTARSNTRPSATVSRTDGPWWRTFGLDRVPFDKDVADASLWLPPSLHAARETIVEAIEERRSVMLCGEPGVGKTCLLRALRTALDPGRFRLTYSHNATLGRRDFYRQICRALGLAPAATAASVFWAIGEHVQQLAAERTHPVFVLDEAHMLRQEVLDHLHILLNYAWDSQPLLSILLVGLPELRERLELRHARALYTRIHLRISLEPVTEADSRAYLAHRLGLAGGDPDGKMPFADAAISLLHESSIGALREIDRIASLAMRQAATRRRRTVERADVDAACRVIRSDSELDVLEAAS